MSRLLAVPASLLLLACGASSTATQIDRFCEVSCARLVECALAPGLTEATCKEQCSAADTAGCDVTEADSQACLDAYQSSTCDELRAGFPEACDRTCDQDSGDTSSADSGGGGNGSGGNNGSGANGGANGGASPVGDCAELQSCCDTLTAELKQVCEVVVDAGVQLSCELTLDAYIRDGHCPAP